MSTIVPFISDMYMSPRQDEMQMHDQNQSGGSSANQSQRLKFRTSCDSCAASKVRCTKEQHGCSRCVQNGLNCIYGRSRRRGKPPSKAVVQGPTHQRSSPSAPPVPPAPWSTEPTHHRPGYNFDCSWYRSSMLKSTNHPPPNVDNALLTEWERRTPNSLNPSLTPYHSTSDESTGVSLLQSNRDFMPWPNLTDGDSLTSLPGQATTQRENENLDNDEMIEIDYEHGDDQGKGNEHLNELQDSHSESCIATACRLLSLLTQFVRSDCHNGPVVSNDSSPPTRNPQNPLLAKEKSQASEVVFRSTRTATETVSRLLNCTSSFCAQDPSTLLVIAAVLLKVLTWYQTLYQAEIGRHASPPTPQQDSDSPPSLQPNAHFAGDKLFLGLSVIDESLYTVPLTIPLAIGALNLPPATETKMKAQLLLCEVQTLLQLCEALKRRAQAVKSIRGEKTGLEESNAHLLRKVGDLQRVLTVVCTQAPSWNKV